MPINGPSRSGPCSVTRPTTNRTPGKGSSREGRLISSGSGRPFFYPLTAGPGTAKHNRMKHLVRSQGFGAVIGVAVMLAVFTLVDFSGWWTVQTVSNVTQFASILAVVTMGEALVIMTKEIDLSVGSVYGL